MQIHLYQGFPKPDRSVWWSTVSKAVLRFRSTRMLNLPSALLHIKSLYTLHKAVSTEWKRLYADWTWCKESKFFKCFSNCCKQVYSINWKKKMYCIRADMNLKYLGHCNFSVLALQKHFFTFRKSSWFKRTINKVARVFS